MATITIASLKSGAPISANVEHAIVEARRILLQTKKLADPTIFPIQNYVVACDDSVVSSLHSTDVRELVAQSVVAQAIDGDLLFLTDEPFWLGSELIYSIIELGKNACHDINIIHDFGSIELGAIKICSGVQVFSADMITSLYEQSPFAAGLVDLSPSVPILITGTSGTTMLTALKHVLQRYYSPSQPLILLRNLSTDEATVEFTVLQSMDHPDALHADTIWVKPIPEISAGRNVSSLLRVAARLRAPGGCPWDREQSAQSLVPSLLEEAYEVVEAVQASNAQHMAEELGDLLSHVVMQSQIAEEAGSFTFEDVVEGISAKLIRRHPHVFGTLKADSADDVLDIWQQVKATEIDRPPKPEHPIDRYPVSMPVIRRLQDMSAPESPPPDINGEEIGRELLRLMQRAIAAGLDPDRLVINAARKHIPVPSQSD